MTSAESQRTTARRHDISTHPSSLAGCNDGQSRWGLLRGDGLLGPKDYGHVQVVPAGVEGSREFGETVRSAVDLLACKRKISPFQCIADGRFVVLEKLRENFCRDRCIERLVGIVDEVHADLATDTFIVGSSGELTKSAAAISLAITPVPSRRVHVASSVSQALHIVIAIICMRCRGFRISRMQRVFGLGFLPHCRIAGNPLVSLQVPMAAVNPLRD